MVALADQDDVAAALGRPLTPAEAERVGFILEKVSDLFRLEAGQQFTPGRSTVRRKVDGGRVLLTQRPVEEVEDVRTDQGQPVKWSLLGQWLTVPLRSTDFVVVTYTHGGSVPDLVRLTVADVARKVLLIDPRAASGVSQYGHTEGPFSEQSTYAAWAQGGQASLSPEDKAIARSFRLRAPHVWVQR